LIWGESEVTAAEFADWRKRMGFNRKAAAEALGLSRNTVQKYEEGVTAVPLHIALACAALVRGIAPWPH
jgi:predicted transcriptional regulator